MFQVGNSCQEGKTGMKLCLINHSKFQLGIEYKLSSQQHFSNIQVDRVSESSNLEDNNSLSHIDMKLVQTNFDHQGSNTRLHSFQFQESSIQQSNSTGLPHKYSNQLMTNLLTHLYKFQSDS